MGKYDYKNQPIINVNYEVALRHLQRFLPKETKTEDIYKEHLKRALKIASLKIVNYQISTKVNMQKVELLRDVIFIGSSFLETTNSNHIYYRTLIAGSFDIIEKTMGVKFTNDFIEKITTSKSVFLDTNFNTVAFYLLFKSHFRYSIDI